MLITNTNVSIVASAQICCFLFALPIVFICQVNAVDLSPCIPDADSFLLSSATDLFLPAFTHVL